MCKVKGHGVYRLEGTCFHVCCSALPFPPPQPYQTFTVRILIGNWKSEVKRLAQQHRVTPESELVPTYPSEPENYFQIKLQNSARLYPRFLNWERGGSLLEGGKRSMHIQNRVGGRWGEKWRKEEEKGNREGRKRKRKGRRREEGRRGRERQGRGREEEGKKERKNGRERRKEESEEGEEEKERTSLTSKDRFRNC